MVPLCLCNIEVISLYLSQLCMMFSLMHFFSIKCRKVPDRPRDPAKWSEIADVVASLSIPVIANGDVFEYDDFQRIKVATGSSNTIFK